MSIDVTTVARIEIHSYAEAVNALYLGYTLWFDLDGDGIQVCDPDGLWDLPTTCQLSKNKLRRMINLHRQLAWHYDGAKEYPMHATKSIPI